MSRIDQSIIERVRHSVGAVGFVVVTDEKFRAMPKDRNNFRIAGTGFLVRERTLITNRHVIQGRNLEMAERRQFDDKKVVQFSYMSGPHLKVSMVEVEFTSWIDDPDIDIDIGFIDLGPVPSECQPVEFCDDQSYFATSQEVAMFGFPGSESLYVHEYKKVDEMYRVGPVLHQGHISALAPFDGTREIDYILSDIQTAKGMSGAPLFIPSTGKVLGIHEMRAAGTTALAIPLSTPAVESLLSAHDEKRAEYSLPLQL